jgi:hypothetical protein
MQPAHQLGPQPAQVRCRLDQTRSTAA